MHLADILIETYTMESVLLRSGKFDDEDDESAVSHIATVFLIDAMARIENAATHIVRRCSEEGDFDANIKVVRECVEPVEIDTIALRHDIADRLIALERYAF
jgi:hypothetical protein